MQQKGLNTYENSKSLTVNQNRIFFLQLNIDKYKKTNQKMVYHTFGNVIWVHIKIIYGKICVQIFCHADNYYDFKGVKYFCKPPYADPMSS